MQDWMQNPSLVQMQESQVQMQAGINVIEHINCRLVGILSYEKLSTRVMEPLQDNLSPTQ